MGEWLPTIADAFAAFLDDRRISCAPTTVAQQRSLLAALADDGRPILSFDATLCRKLILERQGADATRRALYMALRAFGAWCASQGLLRANPVEGVPQPRVRERPHRYLTADDLRRLFDCLGDGKRDTETRLILLLLLEGLRAAELCGLTWADVRDDRIIVRGKGGRIRAVPLRAEVKRLLGERSGRGRIFRGSTHSLRERMARLGRRAGIKGLHPHLLRHSFASISLMAGMDAEHLRTLGGWTAKSDVWLRYIASVREDAAIKAAMNLNVFGEIVRPVAAVPDACRKQSSDDTLGP